MTSSRLRIRVSEDGLAAFVSVCAGESIDETAFAAALRESGIVAGIDSETHERLSRGLYDPNYSSTEALIASGYEASLGRDGWLDLAFEQGIQPGHVREDGTLDYHERDLLKPVCKGDTLGRLHAAEPGTPGLRVDGSRIEPTPVRNVSVDLRSGVATDSEGVLRATRAGVVLFVHGKALDVVDHHVHKGAVDLHSGNLRMNGSLGIRGDVKHAFSAVATGNIDILGNVEGATVLAGGTLHVQGGVRGADGASVCADGDLTITHAESAVLACGGQLRILEATNCRMQAASIDVSRRLRGGQTIAERQITAKEAGAPGGVATRLEAAQPLCLPVSEAQITIARLKTQRMAERAGGRSTDRAKGGKPGRVRAEIDTEQIRRLAERARQRETLLKTASIQLGLAHPGVSIVLGSAQLNLDEATRSSCYSFDESTSSIRVDKVSHTSDTDRGPQKE